MTNPGHPPGMGGPTCKNCGKPIAGRDTTEGWWEWFHLDSPLVNEAFCENDLGAAEPISSDDRGATS